MNIDFNDTRPANASAATLFEVVIDDPAYPSFNSAVTNVRVVRKDDSGAEFVADRKTRIGQPVHAYDRYERRGDLVVERTYEGMSSARSTWTIHPVDATHSTLTIDAAQSMGPVQDLVMRPSLKKLPSHQLHAVHPGGRATGQGSQDLGSWSEGRGPRLDPGGDVDLKFGDQALDQVQPGSEGGVRPLHSGGARGVPTARRGRSTKPRRHEGERREGGSGR
jgi:ribosome-associated toxin RatA of RatAB toxin-antitoxin module